MLSFLNLNNSNTKIGVAAGVLGRFGHVWARLGTKWQERACLGTFGHVWACLGTFGKVWCRSSLISNCLQEPGLREFML